MAKNDVATTSGSTDVAIPDHLKALMQSNAGNEDVGMDQMVIPRIEIIQALSPQRNKNKPEYIEGAEEGMMFNTVTQQLLDSPLSIVPVMFKVEHLVWGDRKQKMEGFFGSYPTFQEADAARLTEEDADKLVVNETHQHYVLFDAGNGQWQEAVISCARSKIKCSKNWNSTIRMLGGPRFARTYELSVVGDQNAAGEDFLNYAKSLKSTGFVDADLLAKAQSMYEAVKAGEHKTDYGQGEEATGSGSSGAEQTDF